MKKASKIITAIIFIVLYAPMLLLIAASFNTGKDLTVFEGFTFTQYGELFRDGNLIRLLLNSLLIAVLSSLIATVVGTMASIGIHNMGRRARSVVLTVTNIPMTNPDIVTGISLALLFAFVGQLLKTNSVLGFSTLLIAHITFNLPYVILSVLPKLRQLNPSINEAALDLGCTPAQSFFKVVLPEILPGIITGAMMAFTMSLDDFVISYFVYGPAFRTLPVEIYSYTKKPLPPKVYALFTLIFLAVLLVMIVMNLVEARDDRRTRKAEAAAKAEQPGA